MAKKERKRLFTFTVPIYYDVTKRKRVMVGMNWVTSAHYRIYSKVKKHYADLVMSIVNNKFFFKGRVEVIYDIYLKRKNADGGNVLAVMSKFVLDGLVKSGVIDDDKVSIVVKETGNYYLDNINPRCEITIKKSKQ